MTELRKSSALGVSLARQVQLYVMDFAAILWDSVISHALIDSMDLYAPRRT